MRKKFEEKYVQPVTSYTNTKKNKLDVVYECMNKSLKNGKKKKKWKEKCICSLEWQVFVFLDKKVVSAWYYCDEFADIITKC